MDDEAYLKQRKELFPGIYTNTEEMVSEVDKYAVEMKRPSSKNQRLSAMSSFAERQQKLRAQAAPVMSTRQKPQIDIWGRIPLKEPEYSVECTVCKRPVNTLRYAQHLDKCLGIGTLARSAALGAPTRNNLK